MSWVFSLGMWLGLLLFPLVGLAQTYDHSEKHYHFQYDESVFKLVTPGFLTTDLVLHRIAAEDGFFPNLTIVSRPRQPGTTLSSEVEKSRADLAKVFPNLQWLRSDALIFRGYSAHLFEIQYERDGRALFLRMILLETPYLFMSLNITVPAATSAAHIAVFTPVLDTLEIDNVPPSESL